MEKRETIATVGKWMFVLKIDNRKKKTKFVNSSGCFICIWCVCSRLWHLNYIFFLQSLTRWLACNFYIFGGKKMLPIGRIFTTRKREMFIFAFGRLFNPIMGWAFNILHFLTDFFDIQRLFWRCFAKHHYGALTLTIQLNKMQETMN